MDGFEVKVPPLRIAHTPEQIKEFSDGGDLFVVRLNRSEIRLEVKAIDLEWTSIEDHPFRDHITVERVATWEGKKKRDELPEQIIILSQYAGVNSAFIVPVITKKFWWKEDTYDGAAKWKQPYFYTKHQNTIDWDLFRWWLEIYIRV